MARGRPKGSSPAPSPLAGSSAAAASSIAAPRRVPTVQTSFTSIALQSLAGDWNPAVRDVFVEVGLGELCKIRVLGNTNRIFSMSLISKIDPDTMKMEMGDVTFVDVNASAVARAIGLPSGGRKIDSQGGRCLADRERLLGKVHALLGTGLPRSNNIPVHRVKKIVQGANKVTIEGQDRAAMKAAVALVASSTFLVPRGATAKIANELLPVVAEPDIICEYDLCDYVVEGLREAARKLRDDLAADPAFVVLGGCLIVPQIIWLDYHEHGLQGVEQLPLPRISSYSDVLLKELIRKHATTFGIDCGLDLADVQRSPSVNIPLSGPVGGHGGAGGSNPMGSSHHGPVLTDEMIDSVKATLEFQFQRREAQFVKLVDSVREKVLEEIKAVSMATRQKELTETLDFFMAHVKQHASVAAVFPVEVPATPRAAAATVAEELAASSREAAHAMMAVVVKNQNNFGGGQGLNICPDGTNEDKPEFGELGRSAARAAMSVQNAHANNEPEDKPMIVDRKGKGKAIADPDVPPRTQRQKTMHELLGPSSAREAIAAAAPLVDTSMMYAMTEDALPATLSLGVEEATASAHARSLAMYTPIGNKRLSVSDMDESPNTPPAPLAVIHTQAYAVPDPDYGYSPFELELVQVYYPDHVCDEFYESAMLLTCPDGLGRVWFESVRPTPLKMDGNKIKYQYSLNGEMGYNGLEAWVRGFNEREIMMMEKVGLPVWRGLVSPDVSLHLENFLHIIPALSLVNKKSI